MALSYLITYFSRTDERKPSKAEKVLALRMCNPLFFFPYRDSASIRQCKVQLFWDFFSVAEISYEQRPWSKNIPASKNQDLSMDVMGGASDSNTKWTNSDPNFEVLAVQKLWWTHSRGNHHMSRLRLKMLKPKKAEVNYLPPHPKSENSGSLEKESVDLLHNVTKRNNCQVVTEKTAKTFSFRRQEIIYEAPAIRNFIERWNCIIWCNSYVFFSYFF